MNHWTTRYVGLPYRPGGRDESGLDCWGLVCLFYRREKNIILPDLPGIAIAKLSERINEIAHAADIWKRLTVPEEGCAVVMSQKFVFHHVGIWTNADSGKVIHCWQAPVIADTLRRLVIRGVKRIEFYGLHN